MFLLCLDVGNTQIFAGVFNEKNTLIFSFRHDSTQASSSDQLGLFLRLVLRENAIEPDKITRIAICSVVPHLEYSLQAACLKYFSLTPYFLTHTDLLDDIKIAYTNPEEVGSDRLATVLAASVFFPGKNLLVADLGTATTLEVITAERQYLGGIIFPGIRLSMDALQSRTAKLSAVNIIKPKQVIGRSTTEGLQSGLYYGQLGALREFIQHIIDTNFSNNPPLILGTGGFAHLFEKEELFDKIIPDLVLQGLSLISKKKQ